MIDLTKLSPADEFEMTIDSDSVDQSAGTIFLACTPNRETREEASVDAAFHTLARAAFDVMMRRKWTAHYGENGWWVDGSDKGFGGFDTNDWHPSEFSLWLDDHQWADPFTALTEAEKYFVANVEKPHG